MASHFTLPNERRSLQTGTAHHYFIPASFQAFKMLRFGFTVLPIVAGFDKFFNFLAPWSTYVASWPLRMTGLNATQFMRGVGVIEIVAGIIVATRPRAGGVIVALWLWGIIINLLSFPGFYDIALRDFGLSLGALALSRLAVEFTYYRPPVLRFMSGV